MADVMYGFGAFLADLWDVVGSVILGVGYVVFWCFVAVLVSFFLGCLAGTALSGFAMVTGL